MIYGCDLGGGQQLQVESQGEQTRLVLTSQSVGQQQSQATHFATGAWQLPPTLFRTPGEWVLRIEGDRGQQFILIRGGSMAIAPIVPNLMGAEVLPLHPVSAPQPPSPLPPLKPLEPMKPMQMGNMEMRMEPMEMRMGNLELRMGNPSPSPATDRRFCSQCGAAVETGDRFCSHCGNALHKS